VAVTTLGPSSSRQRARGFTVFKVITDNTDITVINAIMDTMDLTVNQGHDGEQERTSQALRPFMHTSDITVVRAVMITTDITIIKATWTSESSTPSCTLSSLELSRPPRMP
jgi:hypothetical protein